MNQMPVVHVVDDDPGVRQSLEVLLDSPDFVTRIHPTAEHFFKSIDPDRHGCVISDLTMPGMTGIDLLKKMKLLDYQFPVIMISGHADVSTAVASMKLGAMELIEKPFEADLLLRAVHTAIHIDQTRHEKIEELATFRACLKGLTPRESELLGLIVKGRSNKQISIDLGIAFRTVVNHRAHLMVKTKAENAAGLARLATLAGIGSA